MQWGFTCRGGTSWGVQNQHKSFHRWARRRCKSSVCLLYFWAWSKSWGWQNKASPWYIHLHTPTHLLPRPWWMLQMVILLCDDWWLVIGITNCHISLSITLPPQRLVFSWNVHHGQEASTVLWLCTTRYGRFYSKSQNQRQCWFGLRLTGVYQVNA